MSFSRVSRAAFVFLLAPIGCATADINREARDATDEARADARVAAAYGTCNGAPGPRCGLILEHTSTEAFRERFRQRVCANKDVDACQLAFQKLIDAEMSARYDRADWKAIANWCDRHPPRCDDPVTYERMLMDSHNAAVRESLAQLELSIEAKRRSRIAEQEHDALRATLEATAAAATLLARPRCVTYPSANGGPNVTLCNE